MTDLPNWLFQQFGPAAGYTFPLPVLDVDPDADPLVYVRMNRDWLAYVIAACMPLTLLETWRETDGATLALVTQRAHLLIDMLMTLLCDPLCVDGLRLAGDTLQYSPDGGSTWIDIPNAGSAGNPPDPRTDGYLNPARTGSNIPCLAAANATAVFVELHRELSNWYADAAPILSFFYTIGAVLQLFFNSLAATFGLSVDMNSVAVAVLAHAGSLTAGAFTAEIQEELTCILYRHADANGQWDDTAYAAVLSEISGISGDMWELLYVYLDQVSGRIGLNNAGTTNTVASYDCAGCVGWCYNFAFSEAYLDVASEVLWPPATTVNDPAAHYQFSGSKPALGYGYQQTHEPVGVMTEFDTTRIFVLTVVASKHGSSTFGDLRVYVKETDDSWGIVNYTYLDADVAIQIQREIKGFAIIVYADYDHQLDDITATGDGTCPFGTPNC